jgi:hypothetical protein
MDVNPRRIRLIMGQVGGVLIPIGAFLRSLNCSQI